MSPSRRFLITGGCGFIGSAMIRYLYRYTTHAICNIDKLSYAANPDSLAELASDQRYRFCQIDLGEADAISQVFEDFKPDVVMHFAAESHVDRSIAGPKVFIDSNIVGTFNLLEAAKRYYQALPQELGQSFRFQHTSTDEVFGSRSPLDVPSTEQSRYDPSSPYAASKAAADHLVNAWYKTYGLPVVLSNCSNNFGPWQYPEKLIPVVINSALSGQQIPVYGDGRQMRDWLYVDDHVDALYRIVDQGRIGESYNVAAGNELTNIDLIDRICAILDSKIDKKPHGIKSFSQLITHVVDRPGHDVRYAVDAGKLQNELQWRPETSLEQGLAITVDWYCRQFAQQHPEPMR